MGFDHWGIWAGGQFALWALATSPAIAYPALNASSAVASVSPQIQREASENGGFSTYVLPNTFSILMPSDWFVEGSETAGAAVITSYQTASNPAPTDIRTEVNLVDEPPETYVDRQIDDLVEQKYVIDRFRLASVQGNQAFRVWIIDAPGEFANQIITFVGYENGSTAKIVSYYNGDSPTTVDTIMQMHRSFELVSEGE
jgi:hypothetical protein